MPGSCDLHRLRPGWRRVLSNTLLVCVLMVFSLTNNRTAIPCTQAFRISVNTPTRAGSNDERRDRVVSATKGAPSANLHRHEHFLDDRLPSGDGQPSRCRLRRRPRNQSHIISTECETTRKRYSTKRIATNQARRAACAVDSEMLRPERMNGWTQPPDGGGKRNTAMMLQFEEMRILNADQMREADRRTSRTSAFARWS